MATVFVHAPELAGETGLFLFLRAADNGALLNTGGDALTESTTGVFSCTVAEAVAEVHHARVHSSSTENASTILRDGWLAASGTLVVDSYPSSGSGGSGDASQSTLLEVQTTVEGIAASIAGAATIEIVSNVADGGTITLYVDDDYRVRSGTELDISVADVGGLIHTRLSAIGAANLYFGASRGSGDPGQITGTVDDVVVVGSGASQTCLITVEITAAGHGLTPSEDYVWQLAQQQTQGAEVDDLVEMEGTLILKRRRVPAGG